MLDTVPNISHLIEIWFIKINFIYILVLRTHYFLVLIIIIHVLLLPLRQDNGIPFKWRMIVFCQVEVGVGVLASWYL